MPLTDDGFVQDNFDDVHAQQVENFKSKLGSDIDTSSGSFIGRMIDYQTQLQVNNDQKAHDNYDSSFNDTATGVQLDRLAANSGVQRNQAQYAEAELQIQGKAGYVVDENTEFMTDNADSFYTEQDLQLDNNGQGNVKALSEYAEASQNVDANTIINQANPVDEIETVTNPEAATGGADLENDYYLRNRIKQNDKSDEGPTRDGINTALLNVTGVYGVTIQDNYNNETDINGNPPHSMHVFVSGGNVDDIAKKLAYNCVGATVGSVKRDVDIDGSIKTVRFDIAQNRDIYFDVGIITEDGYEHDAVIESVIDFLSDFEMGQLIVLNRLYGYLYQLNGVKEVTYIKAGTNPNDLSTDNIQLEKYQLATTHEANIKVDEQSNG